MSQSSVSLPAFQFGQVHDSIFTGAGSAYESVVRVDSSMHQAAAETITPVVADWYRQRERRFGASVVDLGCGGQPVTAFHIFDALSRSNVSELAKAKFRYTGVDIKKEPLAQLAQQKFPENVSQVRSIEANAWDRFEMQRKYLPLGIDLLLSNLHLHHGTPESVYQMAHFFRLRMAVGALWMAHVVVMPDGQPYLRRPEDPAQAMVGLTLPFDIEDRSAPDFVDWREDLLSRYGDFMDTRGALSEHKEQVLGHIRLADYPMSMEQLGQIVSLAGFDVSTHYFSESHSEHPLAEFFGVIEARKRS